MTRDSLIKLIAEQLKGKVIERGYSFNREWQIKDVLRGLFEPNDYDNITVETYRNENAFYIRYKRGYLFCLKYTKKKGEWQFNHFNPHYEWYYTDFYCGDQTPDFDLLEKFKEIELKNHKWETEKEREFVEMLACYNQIKGLFGDKTDAILRYINNHKYNIERGSL